MHEGKQGAPENDPIPDWSASLLSFLIKDLPLHVTGEELDLFPRLRSWQPPESTTWVTSSASW